MAALSEIRHQWDQDRYHPPAFPAGSLLLPFLHHAHTAKTGAQLENETQNEGPLRPWGVHKSGVKAYESRLSDALQFLKVGSLQELLSRYPSGALVLDIMSSTYMLEELTQQCFPTIPLAGSAAIALADTRPAEKKQRDKAYNITQITGGVLTRRLWRDIAAWKDSQHGSPLRLIVCCGEGAIDTLPKHPDILYVPLEQMYELLSEDGGTLITQIPNIGHAWHKTLERWINVVNHSPGLQVFFDFPSTMALVKKTGAPKKFPIVPTSYE